MRVRRLAPAAALLLLTSCTAEAAPQPPSVSSPFADCAVLTASTPPGDKADLPDVELPCFTGDRTVRLADLTGPAVINFWASWCPPCRAELPAVQELADRTRGRLTVLGVDSGDSREAAAAFAADFRVSMPTLFDPEKKLMGALGQAKLPVTVFVDASGRAEVYRLPLDSAGLAAKVREHTGVTVTP